MLGCSVFPVNASFWRWFSRSSLPFIPIDCSCHFSFSIFFIDLLLNHAHHISLIVLFESAGNSGLAAHALECYSLVAAWWRRRLSSNDVLRCGIIQIIILRLFNDRFNSRVWIEVCHSVLIKLSFLCFLNWFMICINLRLNTSVYFFRTLSCNVLYDRMLRHFINSISNNLGLLILFNMIVLDSCGLFQKFESIVEVTRFVVEARSHVFGYTWRRSAFSLWWSWHFFIL